jgi:hypothetical protein
VGCVECVVCVGCVGCVGCVCGVCGGRWGWVGVGVGGVWGTFDIPQTALVATLDTYDFYFKGNEKFTINGLHGVLAFYRFYILGCFG